MSQGLSPKMNAGMFGTGDYEWSTPAATFQQIEAEFGPFDLDPCATPENAKCARFFTRADDSLNQPWTGRVYMNPPYGRNIGRWVAKAYQSAVAGALVVCLLPSRTDTAWWHDYCQKGEYRFLRRRLNFADGKNNAPFPSVVVVFRPGIVATEIASGRQQTIDGVA